MQPTLILAGGGSGFGLPPDLLAKDMVARLGPNFDVDVAMKVKDALTVKLKREPTSQELLTAYNQVQAQ